MTTTAVPYCFFCKHLFETKEYSWKCPAFPDGIPDTVLWFRVFHDAPLEGQKGSLVFEPFSEEAGEIYARKKARYAKENRP